VDRQRQYPLNAAGDSYVADGLCVACTVPEHEAPDLMANDPEAHAGYHCYFRRQPATVDELQRAVMAAAVGCCGAARYGGADPVVLHQLAQLGAAEACDHHAESGAAADGRGDLGFSEFNGSRRGRRRG
jgi:hypothetical protein